MANSLLSGVTAAARQRLQAQQAEEARKAAEQQAVSQLFGSLQGQNLGQLAGQYATEQRQQAAAQQQAAQQRAQTSALDQRYFNDLSFLDPTFQMNPALINRSAVAEQAYADPATIAAQQQSYQGLMSAANTPYQWQSPEAQQALSGQWAQVQGGKGAPSFMSGDTQQQMMQQLLGVQAPQFAGAGTQQNLLGQIQGQLSDPTAGLAFDDGSRQAEQYGNLNEIIQGGGATALERANRQAQRADQESWLRGQREADMQDYAERGLTGGGQELLALSADRQSAAGRNSLADLQTAAQLEQRRLDAIGAAGGLASTMRGNTANEQGLLASQRNANMNAATSLANNMRGADYAEKTFLNESARQQALQAAGLAETMRNQQYQEGTYLDQRALAALGQQTDLANLMRNQQFNEQSTQRANQMAGLQSAGSLATQARDQSFGEANTRAQATDRMIGTNVDLINQANAGNVEYMRQAREQAYQNRFNDFMRARELGLTTAQSLMDFDAQQNAAGYNQGTQIGANNAGTYNQAASEYRGDLTGQHNIGNNNLLGAQYQNNQVLAQGLTEVGAQFDNFISMMGQKPSGASTGAASGGTVAAAPKTTTATGGFNPAMLGSWDQNKKLYG